LFDAKPPKGETQRGGHGLAFDWDILRRAPTPKRFILAGGLTPDTVRRAATQTRAAIVDVSSGVEASPGIKDAILMNEFMEQLRG
jgi:phosphoribosylanthranilate isomerase